MSDAYVPIACDRHEQLEFAVLKRQALELGFRCDEGVVRERIQPLDVATRAGAEWLRLRRRDGREIEIRLDAILEWYTT